MKAESLIFRKLTPNEFKAITNTINSEGGGSQTYIDFPKGSISDDDFKEFFGDEGTPNTNGYEWVFYVNSLSIGRVQQKETISARRDSSNSLREQNNENRIEIWKNERSGFPADSYDDKNNPIIVFILKSEDKEFWAGWFYRNDCNDTWPMTKGLSTMFWKDCSYIKFDSPIPFDTHDFRWPFLKNDGIKINRIKMKNLSLQQIYYGAPGTGKTESALQLAYKTGRDIMQVDISRIKSMWVGQSEKNIKALFDYYRNITKRSKRVPILLFNEADGVIGKRKQDVEKSIDKMENSIQNIILQEMESLDGIMIATTNLVQNIDDAFERRFLYKIKFEKPKQEQKVKIWQSLIPAISENIANMLASNYDFSGGQIENIARKFDVDAILYGDDAINEDKLIQYCAEESIIKGNKAKIGFV